MAIGNPEDRLPTAITNAPIASQPSLEHAVELWYVDVHVVDYLHLGFAREWPLNATCVLNDRALPGTRHGQEQRIQARVVEAFANEGAGTHQDPLGAFRNGRHLLG